MGEPVSVATGKGVSRKPVPKSHPTDTENARELTVLDNLANEDANLDEGEKVDDKGDLLAAGTHHAQLAEAHTTSLALLPRLLRGGSVVDVVLHLGVLGRHPLGLVLERNVVAGSVIHVVWRDGRVAALVALVARVLVAQSVHARGRGGLMRACRIHMIVEDGLEGRGRHALLLVLL